MNIHSILSLFFSSNGKVMSMTQFLTIKTYHQKVTVFRCGNMGSKALTYQHLVSMGEEYWRELGCSEHLLPVRTLLNPSRSSVHSYWANKEGFSNNRQACVIKPCRTMGEISLKAIISFGLPSQFNSWDLWCLTEGSATLQDFFLSTRGHKEFHVICILKSSKLMTGKYVFLYMVVVEKNFNIF